MKEDKKPNTTKSNLDSKKDINKKKSNNSKKNNSSNTKNKSSNKKNVNTKNKNNSSKKNNTKKVNNQAKKNKGNNKNNVAKKNNVKNVKKIENKLEKTIENSEVKVVTEGIPTPIPEVKKEVNTSNKDVVEAKEVHEEIVQEEKKEETKEKETTEESTTNQEVNAEEEKVNIEEPQIILENEQEYVVSSKNDDILVEKVSLEDIPTKEEQEEEQNKKLEQKILKKKKKTNVIEPLIVVILLLACFYIAYFVIVSSSRARLNNGITTLFNKANKVISDLGSYNSESYTMSGGASFSTTTDYLKFLSKYEYKFNFSHNLKDNINSGNITMINSLDNNSLDISYKETDDTLYLRSNKLAYYPLSVKLDTTGSNIDYNLLKNNLVIIKDIILEEISIPKSETIKDTISINNQDIKVKKLRITYTKDDINNLVNKVKKRILENDTLVNDIATSVGIAKDKVNDYLNETSEIDCDNISIDVYTKGIMHDVLGISILMDNQELVRVINYNKDYQVKVIDEDNQEIYMTLYGKKLELSYSNVRILSLDINNFDKEKIDIDYEANLITAKYSGKLLVNSNDSNSEVMLTFIDKNDSSINGTLNMNYTKSKEEKTYEFDTTDSMDVDDLSNEEMTQIGINFLGFIINND
jgi:putative mediator of RNA polymerase II transcription subunit 24